jgi:glycosyltransferase involved in cell wall biosynthesis
VSTTADAEPARIRPRTVVIVPAFDEAPNLATLLGAIHEHLPELEIVVIDDGSRDDTAKVAEQSDAHVVRHPFNLGYGAALQSGYKWALERDVGFLLQMDADGQHLPSEASTLLEAVRSGSCDLAIGSRFMAGDAHYPMGAARSLGRWLLRRIAGLAGLRVTDPTSGFQAMNRSALELFASDWYPFDYPDVDVLILAHRSGLRISEHSVRMATGWRESSLHAGWKPLYYGYKMLLSLWAASAKPRSKTTPR